MSKSELYNQFIIYSKEKSDLYSLKSYEQFIQKIFSDICNSNDEKVQNEKDAIYHNFKRPDMIENPSDIFMIFDDIEEFLKEKRIYHDLKSSFETCKTKEILSYLDCVRFIGCYSYNDPENRDLYANNDIVLDYSQYYGSKSPHLGLDYSYANKYFNNAKEELKKIDKNILDENDFSKVIEVINSNSYEEYRKITNSSRVEQLKEEQNDLKQKIHDTESEKSKLIQEIDEINKSNMDLENEIKKLKEENKTIVEKNTLLREEYWKNREVYDYITTSKSWQYTKWLRKE